MHPSSAPAERGGGLVTTATAAAASSTAAKNKGRGAPTLLGASLLHLPRGTPIVVETREDLVFRGGLEWADEKMNLVLSQCECENVSTGEKWSDAQVSVRDRAVRSVVLPPDFDPVQTLLEVKAHERRNREVASRRRKLMTRKALKTRERDIQQQQQQQQQQRQQQQRRGQA